jgi:hypothetical protein
MAIFAVSMDKAVTFRGANQLFSNVYHYQGVLPDAAQAAAIASHLRSLEGPFHSSDVGFIRYKVWSAGGSSTANQMIAQGNLTGVGTQTVDTNMDRERAVLIRFPNGTDVRGRPVYLRKWYHSCGSCSGVAFNAAGIYQNTAQITSGNRATIATAADAFRSITVGGVTYTLCSKRGINAASAAQCHAYLEHHQLGDAWRG